NPTGSTKDRIAKKMVEVAEASGELTPDKTILEPTSGNTGIALAMVASRKGYKLTVVIPDNASEERVGLLRLFGAEIVFSEGDKGTNGSIDVARRLAQDPKYFMPFQYGNAANPLAHYEGTAVEILADLPGITHFVAGMATGGRSACSIPVSAGSRSLARSSTCCLTSRWSTSATRLGSRTVPSRSMRSSATRPISPTTWSTET